MHDIGEIVHDTTILEDINLADDMEFYIHIVDGKYVPYEREIEHPETSVSILAREFDPETWELSPIKEI